MSVQLIPENRRKARRFTLQQKLQILKEWELTGDGVAVAEKHQVHPQTLYRWRKALEQGAETFLSGLCRQEKLLQCDTYMMHFSIFSAPSSVLLPSG